MYVESLHKIGEYYNELSQFDNAIGGLQKALEIGKKYLDKTHLIFHELYTQLAYAYDAIGNFEKTEHCYQESLAVCLAHLKHSQNLASYSALIEAYGNLGWNYSQRGAIEAALTYHKKALKVCLDHLPSDVQKLAIIYNNIGFCFGQQGDHSEALEYYHKTLFIWKNEKTINEQYLIYIYNNIGHCYRMKGKYRKADEYYREALGIHTSKNKFSPSSLAITYNNIAANYSFWERHKDAIAYYHKTLQIYRQLGEGKHLKTAQVLSNIGACHTKLKEFDAAQPFLEKSIEIAIERYGKKHSKLAFLYNQLAHFFREKEDYFQAVQYFQRVICLLIHNLEEQDIYAPIALTTYDNPKQLLFALTGKAECLLFHFATSQHLPDLTTSLNSFQTVTLLIEEIRATYAQENAKLTLVKNVSRAYENAIKATAAFISVQGKSVEINKNKLVTTAFQFSEKHKAAILYDIIRENKAKISVGIAPMLLEKEKELRIKLNHIKKLIKQEQSKSVLKGAKSNQKQILEWQSQHFDYKQEYDQLIERFEVNYPEYYRLKHEAKTVTMGDLQQDLEANTAMISYYLTTTHLYTFTITTKTCNLHQTELPKDFDDLLEDYLFYIDSLDQWMYIESAYQLYQLLIEPAIHALQKNIKVERLEKLVLIPHGKLLYLPFEALLTSNVSPDTPYDKLPYLIQKHTISYHYSATLFHHSPQNNGHKQPPITKSFIGFAPIYADATAIQDSQESPTQPTTLINKSTKNQPKENAFLEELPLTENSFKPFISLKQYQAETTRSVTFNGKKYCELIYSEKEVMAVAKIFEKQKHKTQTLFHTDASKEQFFKQVQDYQYILISAHGIRNDQQPELSGIIFSPNEDSNEEVMYLSDAYHLQLNADLVVLSCCESGVGKLAKGEGMMAMNRGFLYAGAKNIIFTLFKVYDKASSELTQVLFEGIVEHHLPYSKALQRAKLKLIQKKGFTPKAWAGYVLIGG